MNKVLLIGNLSKDPELNYIGSDSIPVCKFSLAVNRSYAKQDGERECDFFNVIAWRTLGENASKFLCKGKKAAVFGRVENRSYDKYGEKRYITEIIAEEIQYLTPTEKQSGPNHDGSGNYGSPPPPPQKKTGEQLKLAEDDGLPF